GGIGSGTGARRAGARPDDAHEPRAVTGLLTPVTTAAWEWRATGTTWRIHHGGGVSAALAQAVAAAVEHDEARWSRFRAGSEVARINAAGGDWVAVSADTLRILEACTTWARRTDGVFQPLVGGALVAWGYRRS